MEHDSVWAKAAKLFSGGSASSPQQATNEDEGNAKLPFGLRSHMLSEQKALLYRALVAALAADAVIFAKVRLSDFLFVSGGGDDLKHAIKMDRKYVDFLLCDPFSMQPLAVIELSLRAQPNEKQRTRDPFVSRALKTAGILLLKIEARDSYPTQELRALLVPKIQAQASSLKAKTESSSESSDLPSDATVAMMQDSKSAPSAKPATA